MGRAFTTKTSGLLGSSWKQRSSSEHHVWEGEEKRKKNGEIKRAGTVLRSHFDGVCCCMFRAGAVGALWQCVGGTAAPDAVCGADTGGRVGPGANQPGHASCGHCRGQRDMNVLLVTEHISVELVFVGVCNLVVCHCPTKHVLIWIIHCDWADSNLMMENLRLRSHWRQKNIPDFLNKAARARSNAENVKLRHQIWIFNFKLRKKNPKKNKQKKYIFYVYVFDVSFYFYVSDLRQVSHGQVVWAACQTKHDRWEGAKLLGLFHDRSWSSCNLQPLLQVLL